MEKVHWLIRLVDEHPKEIAKATVVAGFTVLGFVEFLIFDPWRKCAIWFMVFTFIFTMGGAVGLPILAWSTWQADVEFIVKMIISLTGVAGSWVTIVIAWKKLKGIPTRRQSRRQSRRNPPPSL